MEIINRLPEEIMRRYASVATRRGYCIIGLLMLGVLGFVATAQAETIKIVALGASNTVGRSGTSYPAELQAMLKAKGYDVEVTNAGVNGDTTAGMLARVDSAVPSGTRLVLLNPANINDTKQGIRGEQGANVAQIRSKLAARGIKMIVLPAFGAIGAIHSDSEHFDAAGYRLMAARILPQVMAAIGPPGR
jgi:acyl-CoA thioesterase-1